jgi:hypothetical protein
MNAPRARVWLVLSIAAGALAMGGSVLGLARQGVYAELTDVFRPQALAQDVVNLALVSPAMIVLAVLALRGSLRAYLVWLGVVAFTAYNYVIYAFAIPFGPLYFVWLAVLGMSIWALIGGLATLDTSAVETRCRPGRTSVVAALTLIVVGLCFAGIWLIEDIPAFLGGDTPQSVVDIAAPTNPVHILDLAFFLPAVFVSGALLLRRRPLGWATAPGLLTFLFLTGVPILVTPPVAQAIGTAPAWGVTVPIGALSAIVVVVLVALLCDVRSPSPARPASAPSVTAETGTAPCRPLA